MHVTCIAAVLAAKRDRQKHPSLLTPNMPCAGCLAQQTLSGYRAQAVAHHIGQTKDCTREVISSSLHPCKASSSLYAMHLLRFVRTPAEWMADEGKLTSDNHPYDVTEEGCHKLQEL